jgi:hypothetical protein
VYWNSIRKPIRVLEGDDRHSCIEWCGNYNRNVDCELHLEHFQHGPRTFTGTDDTKGTAVLDINPASIPRDRSQHLLRLVRYLDRYLLICFLDELWLDATI